jgi:anti-sigma regulatory factor (Ser/Thr protein kinase)
MADDHALLTLDLPQRAGAAGAARKALTALNGSLQLVSQAPLHDAQLLISELVASAVRHGGGPDEPISIVVRATPRVLHVEVRDHGRDFERAQLDTRCYAIASAVGDFRSSPRSPIAGASSGTARPCG